MARKHEWGATVLAVALLPVNLFLAVLHTAFYFVGYALSALGECVLGISGEVGFVRKTIGDNERGAVRRAKRARTLRDKVARDIERL